MDTARTCALLLTWTAVVLAVPGLLVAVTTGNPLLLVAAVSGAWSALAVFGLLDGLRQIRDRLDGLARRKSPPAAARRTDDAPATPRGATGRGSSVERREPPPVTDPDEDEAFRLLDES